jgi:excisionase family DNA binding protein
MVLAPETAMAVGADRSADRSRSLAAALHEPEAETYVGRSVLDELLTARQVASIFQLKVSTVEEYARRGVLPSVKVGRHRRFIRSQLEDALSALVDLRS